MTEYTIYYRGDRPPDKVNVDYDKDKNIKTINLYPDCNGTTFVEEKCHFSKRTVMIPSDELKTWKMCQPGIASAIWEWHTIQKLINY